MKSGIIAKLGLAGIFGVITVALGGWDQLLTAFITFIVIDYITGILAAIYTKQLSSGIGVMGIVKKILLLVLVWMAASLDNLLAPGSPYIRDIVIWFLLSNEFISILENITRMGMKVPPILSRILLQVEEQADKPAGGRA